MTTFGEEQNTKVKKLKCNSFQVTWTDEIDSAFLHLKNYQVGKVDTADVCQLSEAG